MKHVNEIKESLTNAGSSLSAAAATLGLKTVNLRTVALIIFCVIAAYQWGRTSGFNGETSQPGPASLDVGTMIRQVQDELTKSEEQRRANNIPPLFEVGAFELEIGFLVRKSSEVGSKFSYEVITVNNRVQLANELTHKLKIVMHPIAEHEDSATSDESQNPTEVPVSGPLPPKKGLNK
ncbi:MAG TPA: trypco2 family protein [Pyrinomonadaceae bacterium]|jgi:hypothetical protein|nr:trypco2 family protein [Pyrinomonadaceae bacterium]